MCDWLYVSDHCSAIDVIFSNGNAADVYKIGGNYEKCNLDIDMLFLKHEGKGGVLIFFIQDWIAPDLRFTVGNSKN